MENRIQVLVVYTTSNLNGKQNTGIGRIYNIKSQWKTGYRYW
jgi:hypothetical protein